MPEKSGRIVPVRAKDPSPVACWTPRSAAVLKGVVVIMDLERKALKKAYVSPKVEKIEFDTENIIVTSSGNSQVGRSRGGVCDYEPIGPSTFTGRGRTCVPQTFSNGRNSGCN